MCGGITVHIETVARVASMHSTTRSANGAAPAALSASASSNCIHNVNDDGVAVPYVLAACSPRSQHAATDARRLSYRIGTRPSRATIAFRGRCYRYCRTRVQLLSPVAQDGGRCARRRRFDARHSAALFSFHVSSEMNVSIGHDSSNDMSTTTV
eukprot:TRINITY_DN766_c0_g1_i5.p1 TRINITY_DN766_c0_g1~~TRINITY_DN766_c0_g1_i5.p1  ORF type:complete len:154 (-),score=22.75 TRINITY_DN766_c0_g1_i5:258-719(-)